MVAWDRIGFYSWKGGDNFGDAPLNDYLVPRLLPKLQLIPSHSPQAILMCIGSILGHRSQLPLAWRQLPWIVFGSGFQYETLDIPQGSRFFALRGAKTQELCHAGDCALADPAILLPLFLPRDVEAVPGSVATIMKWNWQGVENNTLYSTRTGGDVTGWLRRMWQFERIETDSLHAAIVADAYGIAWKPLRWEFKWADHFEQMGIMARPNEFVLSDRALLARKQQELERARLRMIEFIDGNQ